MPADHTPNSKRDFIGKLEDSSELVYKNTKIFLLTLSRLCLLSPFIEDGLRMCFQWNEQRSYLDLSWGCGMLLATVIVLVNLVGQLGSSIMVILHKKVTYACGVLVFVLILETFAYNLISDLKFLSRYLTLIGPILLLVADSFAESHSLFVGVLSVDRSKPKSCLQLASRILIVFMSCSAGVILVRFEFSWFQVFQSVFYTILLILVTIGYGTKLSALMLVISVTLVNVYCNDWWNVAPETGQRDLLKYDFFQTLSVIGGLLMIASRDPGRVSKHEIRDPDPVLVEERKISRNHGGVSVEAITLNDRGGVW